jgi:hypothetical protein
LGIGGNSGFQEEGSGDFRRIRVVESKNIGRFLHKFPPNLELINNYVKNPKVFLCFVNGWYDGQCEKAFVKNAHIYLGGLWICWWSFLVQNGGFFEKTIYKWRDLWYNNPERRIKFTSSYQG